MSGITWTDVLALVPQPIQAHDAAHGTRRVEARMWRIPGADMPYQLQFTLRVQGTVIETWVHDYTARGLSAAHNAYADAKTRAERWLDGTPIEGVRPPVSQHWTINKGAP